MIPPGLFDTPDLHFFAFEGDRALFRRMDRSHYHRSIFLDGRILASDDATLSLPLDELLARMADAPKRPVGWIFHIAHCGSTLLARALDLPERSLVLREPRPLRQLGIERARGEGEGWRERLALAETFAGRRYRADSPVIVKANVPVNFMLDALLPAAAAAPAIMLYFPLRAYLQAILRSPGHRTWVVNVTTQLEPALVRLAGDIRALDVPERAALLWLAQMRCYAEALIGHARARSLYAETLFETPRTAIAAAAVHLGMPLGDGELDALEGQKAFGSYSKDPAIPFDNEARLAQREAMKARLDPEISRARRWLDLRLAEIPLPERLDRPLIGTSPPLL